MKHVCEPYMSEGDISGLHNKLVEPYCHQHSHILRLRPCNILLLPFRVLSTMEDSICRTPQTDEGTANPHNPFDLYSIFYIYSRSCTFLRMLFILVTRLCDIYLCDVYNYVTLNIPVRHRCLYCYATIPVPHISSYMYNYNFMLYDGLVSDFWYQYSFLFASDGRNCYISLNTIRFVHKTKHYHFLRSRSDQSQLALYLVCSLHSKYHPITIRHLFLLCACIIFSIV